MDNNFPGAALVIVKDGEIAFSGQYGYADLDNKIPVNTDKTVFFVESVSKSFTATAIMQLAEKNLIDLHADVNEYLVSFQLESAFSKPVTAADLLVHTGGFDDTDIGAYAKAEGEVTPLKDYVKNHLPRRVLPPGEVVSYSNHGYALAGLLVEEIAAMKFADYMDEEILKPLDMNNSSFILSPDMEKHLALPYLLQNDTFAPGTFLFHNYSPAGGLKATARDMANFIIAHLENGKYSGHQILQESTIRKMHHRQFTHHDKLPGWAFGFYESYINGYRCLVHGGSNRLGHSSLLFMLPDENFGYFLSLNTFNLDLHDQFLEELMDKFYPEKEETMLPQMAGFIFLNIVFLSVAIIWPFTCLRKSNLQDRLKAEKTGLYLAWALAVANLFFLISLAVIFLNYQVELAYGMPGLLRLLFLVPYVILALTGIVLFYAVKMLKEKRLTLCCRIHLTITALCSTGFLYFLYFWNLMGFYNGYR